jgi:hypothetical protein
LCWSPPGPNFTAASVRLSRTTGLLAPQLRAEIGLSKGKHMGETRGIYKLTDFKSQEIENIIYT